MNFQISFTERKGYFTWEELSCLARACGFKGDLFEVNFVQDQRGMGEGMSRTQLEVWLDSHQLDKELHRTLNFRSSKDNTLVIKKAARLVSLRKLSFQEISDARVAFDLYDNESDHEGIYLKEFQTLNRALKLAGRLLAAARLPVELRRACKTVTTPSRIQLHEFLDLLTRSDRIESIVPDVQEDSDRGRLTHTVVDFKKLLQPKDAQRQDKLAARYNWKKLQLSVTQGSLMMRNMQSALNEHYQSKITRQRKPRDRQSQVMEKISEMNSQLSLVKQGRPLSAFQVSSQQGHALVDARATRKAPLLRSKSSDHDIDAALRRMHRPQTSSRSDDVIDSHTSPKKALARPQSAAPTMTQHPFIQETINERPELATVLKSTAPRAPTPLVKGHDVLEHTALMQDLEWDLACGQDPLLRKYLRDVSQRPSTAPAQLRRSMRGQRPTATLFPLRKNAWMTSSQRQRSTSSVLPEAQQSDEDTCGPAADGGHASGTATPPSADSDAADIDGDQDEDEEEADTLLLASTASLPVRDWRQPNKWIRLEDA